MVEVYRAGRQLLKVRALMLFSLACALGACWWGWDLFQTYGIRPADGGVLAPLGTRLALGLGVAALGVAFAAGMGAYGRLYVSAIRYEPGSDRLFVRTVGFIGGRETPYPASHVVSSSYVAGKYDNPGGVSVDAPWMSLRMQGRRSPLIVDAQGVFPDPALAARLLQPKRKAAPKPALRLAADTAPSQPPARTWLGTIWQWMIIVGWILMTLLVILFFLLDLFV